MPTFGVVDALQGNTIEMAQAARDMTAKYDVRNPVALKRLIAAKSAEFKKIHQDMRAFQREQILWGRFSEHRFNDFMTGVKL